MTLTAYDQRIERTRAALERAECVLIGGGSGFSTAAGLDYAGARFRKHFGDFIERYGIEDMYAGTFYPFETQEEYWAHWARHILVNRFDEPPASLYRQLLRLVSAKDVFVITTNVEHQFAKSGFPEERIFEVQGDYAYIQCARGCHPKRYHDEQLVREMTEKTVDCRIPSELVPGCPACGGPMDVNVRKNRWFVEDDAWLAARKRYRDFLEGCAAKRLVLLEIGVGFNTPGIVRYPFERLAALDRDVTLVRINKHHPLGIPENVARTVSFNEEVGRVFCDLEGTGRRM